MAHEGAPVPNRDYEKDPLSEAEIDAIVATEIATDEDKVPVILSIHTGVVTDGVPQFASIRYMLPVSVLQSVRGTFAPYEAV